MNLPFIKNLFQIIIDSLFPISNTDKLLFSYTPEQALQYLNKSTKTPFPDTYSIFSYKEKIVTRLIWNIKYKKSPEAIKIGAYALFQKILQITNNKQTKEKILILPIPITQRRKNERGYNQCELLLDELKKLDSKDLLEYKRDFLIRIHHQDRQTLKNREERLKDSKGVFSVNKMATEAIISKIKTDNEKKTLAKGHSNLNSNVNTTFEKIPVIIIDDVITTGSTMKEAMETLKSAGFSRVIGISLAH